MLTVRETMHLYESMLTDKDTFAYAYERERLLAAMVAAMQWARRTER